MKISYWIIALALTATFLIGCGEPAGTKEEGARPAEGTEQRPAPLEPE